MMKDNPTGQTSYEDVKHLFFEQIRKISINAWGDKKWLDTKTK